MVVVGRHHSGLLPEASFLRAAGVRTVVATAAPFPTHEPIDKFWAAMLDELGIDLFRMDHTGAVQIEISPRSRSVSGFLNGQKSVAEHP
jgi:hypothetical protein